MLFANWKLDKEWLAKTQQLSNHKDLVCLDIFDTCLTRDVDSPIDIFAKIENELSKRSVHASGFAEARENAEQTVRKHEWMKSRKQDITLDEIYNHLHSINLMPVDDLNLAKQLELEIEKGSLYGVPDLLELANYLVEQNIRYCFVSDMYLPGSFLADVLKEKGFHGWEELIISSEYGKTKGTGDIWDIPYFRGKNILHIGDNIRSDVNKPKECGVETILFDRVRSELRTGARLTPNILAFSQQHRRCELQLRADPDYRKDEFFDQKQMQVLGKSFGALMLGAFVLWLKKKVLNHNVSHLLFFARDGFLPREAWKLVKSEMKDSDISDSYLHVSRKVLRLACGYLECKPDFIPDSLLQFLSYFDGNISIRDAILTIGMDSDSIVRKAKTHFRNIDRPFNWSKSENQLKFKEFLSKNSEDLYEVCKNHYMNVLAYFKQERIFEHKKIAIVDTGWSGTLQTSFNQLCRAVSSDFQCIGFYYGLWRSSLTNRYLSGYMESAFFNEFDGFDDHLKNFQGIALIEGLNNPDEGTTTNYSFQNGMYTPVCELSEPEHHQYEQYVRPFQHGSLTTLENIFKTGKCGNLEMASLTIDNAIAAYRLLVISPSNDEVLTLTKLKHCPTFNNKLTAIADMRIPSTVRQASERSNFDWSIGAVRRWQILSGLTKRSMLQRFITSKFTFLTNFELRTFERD